MAEVTTGFVIALGALTTLAFLCVIIASLLSVPEPNEYKKEILSTVDTKEASTMFASSIIFLVGIYVVVKRYWSDHLDLLMKLYFSGCLAMMAVHLARPKLATRFTKRSFVITKVPFIGEPKIYMVDFISVLILGVPMAILYMLVDNWVIQNLLAMLLSVYMIDIVRIPSLVIGGGLLLAYFAYDIYFVFFSDIMVTVAKKINIPAKLLWPREAFSLSSSGPFAMLGLGDIVIPGMYTALCARLQTRMPGVKLLWPVLVSYGLAVCTAMAVLLLFKHAQPVLLYIVPYVLGTTAVTLAFQGQLGAALKLSEDKKDEEKEEEETETVEVEGEVKEKEIKQE